MRKYLLLILIVVFSSSFGQKTLDAKIITNENDTLKVKIKVVSNMFDPDLLYVTSFNTKVTVIGQDGEKTKIEAPAIKKLSLVDYKGKERNFINNSQDKKALSEVLFSGDNLDWYRAYDSITGGENSSDFLFNKITKQGIGVGYFTGLPKKKLIKFMSDAPEMEEFIKSFKASEYFGYETEYMLKIVEKYEAYKKLKN